MSVKVVALVSISDDGVEGAGMLNEPERRCVLVMDGEGIDIDGERTPNWLPRFRMKSPGSVRSSSTCSRGPRCDIDR